MNRPYPNYCYDALALSERVVAALMERGWPKPEFYEPVSASIQQVDWGSVPSVPWMRVCLDFDPEYPTRLYASINYSAAKCGGSANRDGDVSEIIEAIECFRWVLELPLRETAFQPGRERWERIKASHDIEYCTYSCRRCGATREEFDDNLAPDICAGSRAMHAIWLGVKFAEQREALDDKLYKEMFPDSSIYTHTGGPRTEFVLTPRQADEAAGLVGLSKPQPPERKLAPFPERALR